MDVNDLIGEILEQSTYEGCFTFNELLHYGTVHSLTGMGIAKTNAHMFALVIQRGEPEGAIFIDGKGTLFGDKAVLRMSGAETFDLYSVAPVIVDALASRCRVFEKSHLKQNGCFDIPTVGGCEKQRIGVLCLVVRSGSAPVAGAQVSIRKGKLAITGDVTDSEGRVCFRLLNGRYMCVVSNRNGELARRILEFHESQVESLLDIGGTVDENR
jgi:hypothetical protein